MPLGDAAGHYAGFQGVAERSRIGLVVGLVPLAQFQGNFSIRRLTALENVTATPTAKIELTFTTAHTALFNPLQTAAATLANSGEHGRGVPWICFMGAR